MIFMWKFLWESGRWADKIQEATIEPRTETELKDLEKLFAEMKGLMFEKQKIMQKINPQKNKWLLLHTFRIWGKEFYLADLTLLVVLKNGRFKLLKSFIVHSYIKLSRWRLLFSSVEFQ